MPTIDPAGQFVPGTFTEEADLARRNVLGIAAASGCSADTIAYVRCALSDIGDYGAHGGETSSLTRSGLGAALEAGEPVDVPASGHAIDSLGVRRVGRLAFHAAVARNVRHVEVTDDAIIDAQVCAWETLRIGLEPGGATALAALLSGVYQPRDGDAVGVLCCGGNFDIAALLATR